jgi:hypothetical protein
MLNETSGLTLPSYRCESLVRLKSGVSTETWILKV